MSTQTLLLYFATWSFVALTPGPAVMCAISQSTRHGFRASLAGIAGTQAGNACFFVATVLGLATLLKTANTAFGIFRVVGAAYLACVGLCLIVSTIRHASAPTPPGGTFPMPRWGLFVQGLLVQLTNPKALLFVSALLPQFIDPNRFLAPQFLILLTVTVAVDFVVLTSYAVFAEQSARSLRRSGIVVRLERIVGTALVLFGVRLLFARK